MNGPSEAWVTVPAYSGGTLIDDGIFGGIDPNSGNYLPAYDGFSLSLPYASDPSGPGTWPNSSHPGDPWVILTQRYFAATSNPANGAFGIDLGSWTISKWTDLITHN